MLPASQPESLQASFSTASKLTRHYATQLDSSQNSINSGKDEDDPAILHASQTSHYLDPLAIYKLSTGGQVRCFAYRLNAPGSALKGTTEIQDYLEVLDRYRLCTNCMERSAQILPDVNYKAGILRRKIQIESDRTHDPKWEDVSLKLSKLNETFGLWNKERILEAGESVYSGISAVSR